MNVTVYLLHFEQKIGNPENKRAQAQHYIGSAADFAKRISSHRQGRSGAGIVRAFHERGIPFTVARTWERPDGRAFERYLKRSYHDTISLCPVCSGSSALRRAANVPQITPEPTPEIPF